MKARLRFLVLCVLGVVAFGCASGAGWFIFRETQATPAVSPPYSSVASHSPDTPNPFNPRCRSPRSQTESGLCAQWAAVLLAADSNRVARANLWTSIAALLVAGVGAIFVIRSVRQSDRAIREAQAANRIASEGTEAQLRAWVNVDIDPQGLSTINGNPRFRCKVVLTNSGSTPARNVSYYLGMTFGEAARMHVENSVSDFESGALDWADTILFPGEPHIRTSSTEHSGEPITETTLHVFVIAAYETVFSEKKRTTSRMWQVHDNRRTDGLVDVRHLPHLDVLFLTHGEAYAGDAT